LVRTISQLILTKGLQISSLRSNFDYHCGLSKGSRLLRYSLEAFSHSQLSITVQKGPSKPGLPPNFKWYFLLTWIIILVGFYLLRPINHSNRLSQNRLDEPNEFYDTWSETPTVTVTTTLYGSAGTRWWFGEPPTAEISIASSTHAVAPSSSTVSSSPGVEATVTTSPMVLHSYQDPSTTETSLNSFSSQLILKSFGLMPIENMFTFTWSDEHLETLKHALEKVIGTMESVWNIFRKVYHYPLDPP